MSELPEIKQSEKYPDEITSFILGNCFNVKETLEIVHRCNCHDELVTALEAYEKIYHNKDSNLAKHIFEMRDAHKLAEVALDKTKVKNEITNPDNQ